MNIGHGHYAVMVLSWAASLSMASSFSWAKLYRCSPGDAGDGPAKWWASWQTLGAPCSAVVHCGLPLIVLRTRTVDGRPWGAGFCGRCPGALTGWWCSVRDL